MSDTILTADETATDDEEIPDAPPAPDHPPAAKPDGPGVRPVHTPGGLPAVPLTVIGANSTVAAVSASVLTAGAPVTGLAAVGIAATAAGAAALRRRSTAKQDANRANRKTGHRARHGSSAAHAGTGRAGGSPRGRGNGTHTAPGSAGRSGARSLRASGQAAKLRAGEAGRNPRGVKGAFGAVKAARAERQAAAPTRGERRRQDTADRRNLSDARRAAKAARKADQRAARGKGPSSSGRVRPGDKRLNLSKSPKPPKSGTAGRRDRRARGRGIRGLVGSARERMRQAMRRMRSHVRAAKDERTARRLAGMRELRKRAWARWRLWRRLTASALRCYGRKIVAAAISVPFFAIGMITHPIGVRLRWRWLMWPGQRVYARLAAAARRAREDRDITIRAEHKTTLENAAADEDEEPIGSRVRRAPRSHHAYAGTSTGGSTMSTTAGPGFLFNESASEMEAAAKNYDPDGMMHVHDTIKGFPEALESVAKTFAILAQKADEEFPLEPEVGTSLDAIYEALQLAIDEAEDAFDTFRVVHEQDIRRHEEPRNNAEEGWDTTNNQ
ncbi:hypothetical protein [Streptomyces rapamycinicus]|uniref:Uncharacterized protein n=2 Tax=Streptomyces rapamycinicus TaxID=1226757 RepID=A0A3L8RIM0_STRRN|nr:hypothetical protein [Streptomyces rapamycinicus]MBB4785019.1 hypothetical protein [Streptomyces rapamycinicus]RLV79504.1 hypothetical protein D3C57_114005 [Streptomyces rapamycinicus NRRL 5491]UTO65253.1 hypothetical protein LJB45_24975 [Streptomyces rapamycinicus]UTP33209.1 hypothetical protein LIV37_30105 [Streptomyces rapamycinicus NRRL 5491]